jgi:hypothetical protein
MSRILAVTAAALLALALPVLAPAQQPPRTGDPSISASPETVTFGSATTISGKLRGRDREGVVIVLERNPHPFAGFTEVGTATTNSRGQYSFRVTPERNTRYRVTARRTPPEMSAEVLVRVRIRVSIRLSDSTPRRGAQVRFSGSAVPAHDGRLVRIQRRTATGTYRTVARTRLRDAGDVRSAYSRRLRIFSDGLYRVHVSGDADHATGVSRVRALRVH